MRWRNGKDSFGVVTVALHWLVAVTVVGLFALGLWMRTLGYYDRWYDPAPTIHKAVGVMLCIALVVRVVWRRLSPVPPPLPTLTPFAQRASRLTHGLLYGLLFAIILSGYLIATAAGHPVAVFGLFEVPSTLTAADFSALRDGLGRGVEQIGLLKAAAAVTALPKLEDLAGSIHLALAWAVIALASVHALAALKHHFIDRDATLVRMLGRGVPKDSR